MISFIPKFIYYIYYTIADPATPIISTYKLTLPLFQCVRALHRITENGNIWPERMWISRIPVIKSAASKIFFFENDQMRYKLKFHVNTSLAPKIFLGGNNFSNEKIQ